MDEKVEKIRKQLKEKGFTVQELATASGVPYGTARIVCGGFGGSEKVKTRLLKSCNLLKWKRKKE